MRNQPPPCDLDWRIGRVALDVSKFLLGDPRMLVGPVIEGQPEYNPDEPEKSGHYEGPLPAVLQCYPGHGKSRDNHADISARVEDACGEGPLLLGKPLR